MYSLSIFTTFLVGTLATVTINGCSSSSSSANRGPADAASFSGVVMDINPRITFVSTSTFTYENSSSGNSDFPYTGQGSFSGSFAYYPSSGAREGRLILNFTSETPDIDDLVIDLDNFNASNGVVLSARGLVNSTRYPINFSGQPLLQAPDSSGGGIIITTSAEEDAAKPDLLDNSDHVLVYTAFREEKDDPFSTGQVEDFSFGEGARLTVVRQAEYWGSPVQVESEEATTVYYYRHPSALFGLAVAVEHTGEVNRISVLQSVESREIIGVFLVAGAR